MTCAVVRAFHHHRSERIRLIKVWICQNHTIRQGRLQHLKGSDMVISAHDLWPSEDRSNLQPPLDFLVCPASNSKRGLAMEGYLGYSCNTINFTRVSRDTYLINYVPKKLY